MRRVVRLETLADARDTGEAREISVSCRHEAVLDDGGRVVLLDGRGWTAGLRGSGTDAMDAWALTSEPEIAETARVVVGPDEPYGGLSQADMETSHWNALAETLRTNGVVVDAAELRRLPHDVVLGNRLRTRIIGPANGAARPAVS
ncbi:MAG TPA: hypothetical protein VGL44_10105 [Gaiellales bacterium]|jgi:hypothetical protein